MVMYSRLGMQQEFAAVARTHPGDQVGAAVLDALVLSLQQLDGLTVEPQQLLRQVRGQALQGIAADDVFGNHRQRLA
jgi:hypothetical protein